MYHALGMLQNYQIIYYFGICNTPIKVPVHSYSKDKYLGFVFDSLSIPVSLSNNKKKANLDICENTLITSKVTIRHIARILGKFSSSFHAVRLGWLHYRALEIFKTEALKEHKGNFDKIVIITNPGLDDIYWWKLHMPSEKLSEKILLLQ